MSTPTSDDSRLGKPSLTPPVSPRSGQPPPARTEPVTATDDAATTIKIMNRAFMYRLCAVRAPLGSGRVWLSRDRNTVCSSPSIHFHVAWTTSVVHGRLLRSAACVDHESYELPCSPPSRLPRSSSLQDRRV